MEELGFESGFFLFVCLFVGYSMVNLVELCFDGAGGWGDFDELVD